MLGSVNKTTLKVNKGGLTSVLFKVNELSLLTRGSEAPWITAAETQLVVGRRVV